MNSLDWVHLLHIYFNDNVLFVFNKIDTYLNGTFLSFKLKYFYDELQWHIIINQFNETFLLFLFNTYQ